MCRQNKLALKSTELKNLHNHTHPIDVVVRKCNITVNDPSNLNNIKTDVCVIILYTSSIIIIQRPELNYDNSEARVYSTVHIQYSTVQYSTVQYSTVLYCTNMEYGIWNFKYGISNEHEQK